MGGVREWNVDLGGVGEVVKDAYDQHALYEVRGMAQ